jgi:predicted negative regulator of RcsB-dependent stress response
LKGVETDTGIFCYPFLERSNLLRTALSTEKFAVFKSFLKSTKVFLFLAVLLIAGGISAYGQSWLERVSNSARRANEAVQGVNDNKRACHSLKTM